MPPKKEKQTPTRLKKEPLLEAIWELRFQSPADTVENLLSGIIYDHMRHTFAPPTRLPGADIPLAARVQQPALNYTPMFRFGGKNENASYDIQVAPRAIALNCRQPYPSWDILKTKIMGLAEIVRQTGMIEKIERFSLKYLNLIPAGPPDYLSPLNGAFRMGEYNLGHSPLQVQSQIPDGDFTHVITLLAPARVQMEQKTGEGLLIDIDTIFPAISDGFWEGFGSRLDAAHTSNHAIFFDILKQETVDLLEPEYDKGGAPQ